MEYRKGKEKEEIVRIGELEREREKERVYGAGEPRELLERNGVARRGVNSRRESSGPGEWPGVATEEREGKEGHCFYQAACDCRALIYSR